MARGLKKHMKRLNAPKHWMLDKLGGAFAPKPSSEPHKPREYLPLILIIRNRLKYVLTYPAGFMEVVSIPEINENFRLLYESKGSFRLHSIRDEEAKMALQLVCKGPQIDNSKMIFKGSIGGSGIGYLSFRQQPPFLASTNIHFSYQLNEKHGTALLMHHSCRSFASSSSSQPPVKNQTEARKDLSTAEDPFDSPTYHIPEKPVTFVEGASYGIVILVAIGIAAAAAYGVLRDLIFQPKEYKVFSKALERVQNDSQVRVRIGTPIKGYGQDTRNRAARQQIPHRIWKDEDGVEHVEVHFYISGRDGNGKVEARMFKDKDDGLWKFVSLIVFVASPSPAQLILESYLPA